MLEWLAVYDAYLAEFCDEKGVQEENLTPQEARGLKSLKKRVADGTLVVCQTDKSGRFAIMSQEEYLEAGMKHVAKDEEVGLEFLIKNQRRLNGHMSMILKTFNVGASWNHQARIRATKLTHSLSVAPLYLLYKDHKGWTVETGGAPPTRPVASAGGGQDDHMSEMVSLILEPVANTWTGGMETTSTQDFVSKIVELNNGKIDLEEEVDLAEIDRHLDEREENADRNYRRINEEEFLMDGKVCQEDGKCSTGMEDECTSTTQSSSNISKGNHEGQAKVHFQVIKTNKKIHMDTKKINKIENVHLGTKKSNIKEKQTIQNKNQNQKNNTFKVGGPDGQGHKMSFPVPGPDDHMIEEMLDIEECESNSKERSAVNTMTVEEKFSSREEGMKRRAVGKIIRASEVENKYV